MIKKLLNPYINLPGYNCFGCSPNNNFGLKMKFYDDGVNIICKWDPQPQFQGYKDTLHGGIQATLIDETGSLMIPTRAKRAGVTSKLEVKYLKPVYTNKGEITIKATLDSIKRNLVYVTVQLFDNDNTLCSEGKVIYFAFSDDVSREKFFFPGIDKFYER